MSLPKIFLWCEATGRGSGIVQGSTRGGDVIGYAVAEDGTGLSSHLSSSVGFSQHDMGFTGTWKHDVYKKHYPDGYEVEWVNESDIEGHEGLQAALVKNKALWDAAKR